MGLEEEHDMRESFPTADIPPDDGGFALLEEVRELPEDHVDGYGDVNIFNEEVTVVDSEIEPPLLSQKAFLDSEFSKGSMAVTSRLEGSMGEVTVEPDRERNILIHGVAGNKHAIAVMARMPGDKRMGTVQSFTDVHKSYVAAGIGLKSAEDTWAVIMTPGEAVQDTEDGSSALHPRNPEDTAALHAKVLAAVGEGAVIEVVPYDAAAPVPSDNDSLGGILMIQFGADNTTQVRINNTVLQSPYLPQEQ
jgi:hypothetical protein